jgi:hypothetical protein
MIVSRFNELLRRKVSRDALSEAMVRSCPTLITWCDRPDTPLTRAAWIDKVSRTWTEDLKVPIALIRHGRFGNVRAAKADELVLEISMLCCAAKCAMPVAQIVVTATLLRDGASLAEQWNCDIVATLAEHGGEVAASTFHREARSDLQLR